MLPPALALSTSRASLSSMAFSSNVYFWLKDNYFDSSSEVKPLLHTWSLSLEEQFYVIWPPIIAFFSRKHGLVLGFLAGISVVLSFILDKLHPSFSFFQLPTRLFQFAAGALVAVYFPSGMLSMQRRYLCDTIVFNSLAALFFCYKYVPTPVPPFVSPWVAVLASTLVAVRHGFISSVILSHPLVGTIGKLSYSAYLVHWPLYVFALFLRNALHQPVVHPGILLCLTFLLAKFLQKAIEDPVRRGQRRLLFWVIVSVTFIFSLCGQLSQGFQFRIFKPTLPNKERPLRQRSMRRFCLDYNKSRSSGSENVDWNGCRVGDLEGTEAPYVVVGDSFAHQMLPGLHVVGKKRREYYRVIFRNACPFYTDTHKVPPYDARVRLRDTPGKPCGTAHRRRWDAVKRLPRNTTFIVANHWIWRDEASPYNVERQIEMLRNMTEEMRSLGNDVIYPIEPPGLHKSENWLFECTDMLALPLGRTLRALRWFKKNVGCIDPSSRLRPYLGRTWHADGYRRVSKELNVTLIDVHKELCLDGNDTITSESSEQIDYPCRLPVHWEENEDTLKDIGYSRDGHHLSVVGSLWMADLYERALIEHEKSRRKR